MRRILGTTFLVVGLLVAPGSLWAQGRGGMMNGKRPPGGSAGMQAGGGMGMQARGGMQGQGGKGCGKGQAGAGAPPPAGAAAAMQALQQAVSNIQALQRDAALSAQAQASLASTLQLLQQQAQLQGRTAAGASFRGGMGRR